MSDKISQETLYRLTAKGMARVHKIYHVGEPMMRVMRLLLELEEKEGNDGHTWDELYTASHEYTLTNRTQMSTGFDIAVRLGYIEKCGVRNTP